MLPRTFATVCTEFPTVRHYSALSWHLTWTQTLVSFNFPIHSTLHPAFHMMLCISAPYWAPPDFPHTLHLPELRKATLFRSLRSLTSFQFLTELTSLFPTLLCQVATERAVASLVFGTVIWQIAVLVLILVYCFVLRFWTSLVDLVFTFWPMFQHYAMQNRLERGLTPKFRIRRNMTTRHNSGVRGGHSRSLLPGSATFSHRPNNGFRMYHR